LKDSSITGLQINCCLTDKGEPTFGLTYPSQTALFSRKWWELLQWFVKEEKKRYVSQFERLYLESCWTRLKIKMKKIILSMLTIVIVATSVLALNKTAVKNVKAKEATHKTLKKDYCEKSSKYLDSIDFSSVFLLSFPILYARWCAGFLSPRIVQTA